MRWGPHFAVDGYSGRRTSSPANANGPWESIAADRDVRVTHMTGRKWTQE